MAKSTRMLALPARSASFAVAAALSASLFSGVISVPAFAEDEQNTEQNTEQASDQATEQTTKDKATNLVKEAKRYLSDSDAAIVDTSLEEAKTDEDYLSVARTALTKIINNLGLSAGDQEESSAAVASADIETLADYLTYIVAYRVLTSSINDAPDLRNRPAYKFGTAVEKLNYDSAINSASQSREWELNNATSLTILRNSYSEIQRNINALSGQTALENVVKELTEVRYLTDDQIKALYYYGSQASSLSEFSKAVESFAALQWQVYTHVIGRETMEKTDLYKNATDDQRKAYTDAVDAGESVMENTDSTDVTSMQAALDAINTTFNAMADESNPTTTTDWRAAAIAALAATAGGAALVLGASALTRGNHSEAPAPAPAAEPAPAPAAEPAPAPEQPVVRPALANTGFTPWMLLLACLILGAGIIVNAAGRRKA
ncbi:MAG: hypothetical protein Q3972_02840 [Corynebacterium sp.]|nr:hypothetical protein [Corynebacterium sp.]